MLRIGIDIGGTFTDFVIHNSVDGSINTFKLLTDNNNPANTVLTGLEKIIPGHSVQIIHGSTVATNALLERKGARTALITTQGFKDVLQIGRQNRPDMYELNIKLPIPLVPLEYRFEVIERIDSKGKVITPVDISQIEDLIQNIAKKDVDSIAICFLFSFLYPLHEQLIAERLKEAGYLVSASSEILPEFREYERMSTTVVNAYVSPILDNYLSILDTSLPNTNTQIMQSNGGMINLHEARKNGVRCILSGPAGGIVGAQNIAETALPDGPETNTNKYIKLITFDMGGTSTDVSIVNGEPTLTTDAIIGGCPIHLPLLDIHTIGAGGGSIAHIDAGGSLRVGPHSAGAMPGPACYGVGEAPTVTDANLVLGRLNPGYFLGGRMRIFPERAYEAISTLGQQLNLNPIQAAMGVIDVINIQMERALRVISVERGYDPREYTLFSFGGAGGLHACTLAHHLGIPRVMISKFASTLSAFGMLASNVIKDYVQTVMLSGTISFSKLEKMFLPLTSRGISDILDQGISVEKIEIQKSIDARYVGQSYELNIPHGIGFAETFRKAHSMSYGYSYADKNIEIVNIRVRAIGNVSAIHLPETNFSSMNPVPNPTGYIDGYFTEKKEPLLMYEYERLLPGTRLFGPALIVSPDTTIYINHSDLVNVDKYQNLLIDIKTE